MKKYTPISCDFIDIIEHYATLRTIVEVSFINNASEKQMLNTRINTWKNDGKAEWLYLDAFPEAIRMDKIISIEGKALSKYC